MSDDTTPLAYIKGVAPFMGYEFYAEPGTIYPREVSSIVVNTILVDLVRSGAPGGAGRGGPFSSSIKCGLGRATSAARARDEAA